MAPEAGVVAPDAGVVAPDAGVVAPDAGAIAPAALAHVLENIELGVIGIRIVEHPLLLFSNEAARELLGEALEAVSVARLFAGKLLASRNSAASLVVGDWITIGEKSVGYSVYEVPDGSHWVILRDVTEKLRMQRAAEGMTVANNLGYTFAGVAHELGNPINSIKMAATVLRENMTTFDLTTQCEYLTEILSETRRVEDIVRLMQGFIGMETLQPITTDLAAECRAVVERVGRDATDNGIVVVSAFAARGVVPSRVDPSAVRQVLLNLFANAVDAVEGETNPQIAIDTFLGERAAHLRVSDNGHGIDPLHKERLFFPFYSTRPGGIGFGLVIVKKLVSTMGGTIEVTSAPRAGATFEVQLPLVGATAGGGAHRAQ